MREGVTMWIESYKSKGQTYYRAMPGAGEKPVHLGTAEQIVRKVRPELAVVVAERKKKREEPTETQSAEVAPAHELLPFDVVGGPTDEE